MLCTKMQFVPSTEHACYCYNEQLVDSLQGSNLCGEDQTKCGVKKSAVS